MAKPKMEEEKTRFALWVTDESLKLVKDNYKQDNCRTQSEYIEKAIVFYSGYVNSIRAKHYLPEIITSTLKSIVKESETKQNRLLYKIAVELSVLSNVIASSYQISSEDLNRVRGECIKTVNQINGALSFEEAVKWQE